MVHAGCWPFLGFGILRCMAIRAITPGFLGTNKGLIPNKSQAVSLAAFVKVERRCHSPCSSGTVLQIILSLCRDPMQALVLLGPTPHAPTRYYLYYIVYVPIYIYAYVYVHTHI